MALFEKQKECRKNFVEKVFHKDKILENYSDFELVLKNDDEDFPYIYITVSAITKESGLKRISELKTKREYIEWKNNLRKEKMKARM